MADNEQSGPVTEPMPAVAEAMPAGVVTSTPTIRMRITVFVHGVLLPSVLLGMSLNGLDATPNQPWQSGQWEAYAGLLLSPRAWAFFAPGFLYAMVSISTWAIMPETARFIWLRLGIYTGAVLSVHYGALLMTLYHVVLIIATAIVWPVWYGILWLLKPFFRVQRQFTIWHIMVLTTVVAAGVIIVQLFFEVLSGIFFSVFMPVLLASPLLNAIAYLYVARQVAVFAAGTSGQPLRWIWAGIVTGVLIWLAGLRYTTLVMLDEYSKLPTTNPNCYFANAAAHAPGWLTGAKQPGEITACIRRLKFLEIVLKAACPRLHQFIRQRYDSWGLPLAAYCQQYLALATLTCLLLKPLELAATLMRISLRIEPTAIDDIYKTSHPTSPF